MVGLGLVNFRLVEVITLPSRLVGSVRLVS